MKFVYYKKELCVIVEEKLFEVLRGSIPTAELVESAVEHGGLYLLQGLKPAVLHYVFKDSKELKLVESTSEILQEAKRLIDTEGENE